MCSLQKRPVQGNVLLTVIIFTAVLAGLVCSTLLLASSKNTLTVRSMNWNNAMPLAEAGIEEALAQLQLAQSTNFSTNGWILLANGNYSKTRTNLINDGYYTVAIQPTNYQVGIGPTIISTGYVAVPFGNINWSVAPFTLTAGGAGTNLFIHRTVTVATALNGGTTVAVLVKNKITMSGSACVDSFNSQNSSYSSNGLWTASRREANATVASLSTLNSNFKMSGSSTIRGSAALGASSGTPSMSGGPVGDLAYVAANAGHATIQSGHLINNYSASIPDAVAPFTSGSIITSGTYSGTNYTYYAGAGNYSTVGNLTIAGGQSMVIAGKAVIYVSGKFAESGSGFMYIAPGASLTMYVAGTSCTISGNGVINGGGVAANCAINCLPACTTGTISGSGAYIGTFNAPQASVTLSGSADMSGAVVANNVTFSGGMNLHYDESLGGGNGLHYAVTAWQELP